jgi:hypothetical protein
MITVVKPIRVGKTIFQPGETISELSQDEEARLIARGYAEAPEAPADSDIPRGTPETNPVEVPAAKPPKVAKSGTKSAKVATEAAPEAADAQPAQIRLPPDINPQLAGEVKADAPA